MLKRKFFNTLLCFLLFFVLSEQVISASLRSGPMLGYSEMTETVIWLQTRNAAKVFLKYWKAGEPKTVKNTKVIQTSEENDHIARFVISGLDFGTHYEYEVYLDNQKLKFNYPLQFETQKHWRWRTDPPEFKFAFGSCAYINDPPFDRPGSPYGSGFQIFDRIADQKPNFMLWLGDNIYYREPDWLTESAMRYRFAQNRALPELQRLLAATHHYAIWDDHDYGPNDSDRTFRGKEWALRVFQDYWANISYGTPETKGIFGRFEWGDVEFFMLDDRYYRTPEKYSEADRQMFGEEQMRWLRESLLNSQAVFKVIVNGNQMLNPQSPFESWSKFPEEQQRFFEFLKKSKIEGVVFLSGDRHFSELLKRTDITDYPLYDFTASPLSAGNARPSKPEEENPHRVSGTLVTGVKNFGLIEVSGKRNDRKLTLKIVDINGEIRWNYEISEKELKVKR